MLRTVLTKKGNTWYKRKSPTSSSRPGQSPLGGPHTKKTQKRSTSNSSNAWTKRTMRRERENAKQKPIELLSPKKRKEKKEAFLKKEQRQKNAITNWKKRQLKLARSSDEESSEEN